eukprot:GFYU01004051.1.p1 GENE.GFYU01004051.1~~GFYU01004051.1.p1  ORF type:complete len:302 (-),score=86.86 GFYU01004051.1:152-1057(-)
MILLEEAHRVIVDALTAKFIDDDRSFVDIRCTDFDDFFVRVLSDANAKNLVNFGVTFRSNALPQLKEHGLEDYLNTVYSHFKRAPENIEACDLTWIIDLDSPPANKEQAIQDFAQIKYHILGSPLQKVFDGLVAGNAGDPFKIDYRQGETMYVCPSADRIVTVFAMQFKDKTDEVIARVFFQEFAEAKRVSSLAAAPLVSWSEKVPVELEPFKLPENDPNVLGFVSITVFKTHIEKKRQVTANMIQGFRSYFNYHIKCSKAYMHTRMRNRVSSLLQILNRAKLEKVDAKKKTASGRAFERK